MAKKRRGMSAAFLKNLRRKHGLGEFKGKKRRVKRSRGVKVARRRDSRRSKSEGGTFNREVVGAFLYGAVGENLLDQLTSKLNVGTAISADLIKGVAGYFVAKRTTGFIKGMGQAAVAVSAYKVGKSGLGLFGVK